MQEFALKIGPSASPWVIEPPGDLKIFGLNAILQIFITFLLIASVIISLTYLIWGGIDYIMSEGEKQRIQQARQKFIFAIIGLIVVLLAFGIVGTVGHIFGINFFGAPIGNIIDPCAGKLPGKPC